MTLRALSASQAERFDPEQVGGCKRRWYFQDVMRLEVPEPEESKNDGHAGHALFAMHYRGEPLPKRHRMLKVVRGAIAKGELPAPAPGQLIESRFDGQPARDVNGERVPLDISHTLRLGGAPWDGYVDLRFYREGTITVLDHKFSSDIHAYAKPADQLLATVQMPVYALDSLRIWPEAQHVELVHHYVSRKGVDSFLRRQLVTVEQVRQRGREIERLVRDMLAVSEAPSADEVPGNRASCHTWSGCPFQSRCTAFKEKPRMELNDEEQEWLSALGGGEAKPATAFEVVRAAVPPLSDMEKHEIEQRTGVPADALPLVKAPITGPEARAATELEISSSAGALDSKDDLEFEHHGRGGVPPEGLRRPAALNLTALPPDDNDPFAVFAPKPSIPTEQPARPPSCGDCGAELSTENGSQRDGVWTHIGCPAKSRAVRYNVQDAADGKNPWSDAPSAASASKCPDCPHPAHSGAACTGKRGRGTCKCVGAVTPVVSVDGVVNPDGSGAITVTIQRGADGHLSTCVQSDGGKWLCMEGCGVVNAGLTGSKFVASEQKATEEQQMKGVVEAWSRVQDPGSSEFIGEAPAMATGTIDLTPSGDPNVAALQREREMHRRTLGELDASERALKTARTELERFRAEAAGAPIPMLLWCPACHTRHIDEGEFVDKPHHTHACQSCGLAWRPAVVPTVGVKFLPGFKND